MGRLPLSSVESKHSCFVHFLGPFYDLKIVMFNRSVSIYILHYKFSY
jgi:hypothetical protein